VTTLDRLERWKADGVITADQHLLLGALVRHERTSVFVELSALLYIGVLSIVGGVIWVFRDYVVNLGDAVIFSILAALVALPLYYCFTRGKPYEHGEVESPSLIFDYVLYFGCLMFSATLGFAETRFSIFNDWSRHLLIASMAFGLLAYRFDNRFVLSLAISTLAGFLGLEIDAFNLADTHFLRFTALAFGTTLAGLGVWLHRQGVKPHFLDTFVHVAANVIMLATISGVLERGSGWVYLTVLLALSALAVYLGIRFRRFAFVAYGTLYGYAGISARLLNYIGGPILGFWYFIITGVMVVAALTMLARRFGRDE
jgi:Predicted membrane protein (DUF2157)